MFELTLITTDGRRVYPAYVTGFTLKQSFDTPADSLLVSVAMHDATSEYAEVELRVAGELVFCGMVDEERHIWAESGRELMISARSFAAALLDNEACPQSFYQMTLKELKTYYLEPCRITKVVCSENIRIPLITVTKGMSVYELCETVAAVALLPKPRVRGRDTIDFTGGSQLSPVLFSCDTQGGTPFSRRETLIRRCDVISDVLIQSPGDQVYRSAVINRYAWDEYLKRSRYFIPPAEWTSAPNLGANQIIQESMLNRFAVKLISPVLTVHPLLSPAEVEWQGKRTGGLFIAQSETILDGEGFHTEYILRDARYKLSSDATGMELHYL